MQTHVKKNKENHIYEYYIIYELTYRYMDIIHGVTWMIVWVRTHLEGAWA